MAKSVKDIYMAGSLGELQTKAAPTNFDKSTGVKVLFKGADRLYDTAEKTQATTDDEELTYYYFFRYVETVNFAKGKPEYKKEKAFYDKLLSPQKFRSAIEKLEKLTESLEKRYALKKDIENADSKAKQKEFDEALQNEKNHQKKTVPDSKDSKSSGDSVKPYLSNVNGIVKSNGVEKEVVTENGGISPPQLKSILEQKTKSILLVDCRDNADFTNNHINHSNCICIPATMLTGGMSANAILTKLKEHCPESWVDWNRRNQFDHIVLYDWNSTIDNRLPVLNIVYDALTKWDPSCRNTDIRVIQGGMKNIYYTYPSLLTNPQTASAINKTNGSATDLLDLKKLESISYPDIDGISSKNTKPMQTVNNFEVNSNNFPNGNHYPTVPLPSKVVDVPKSGGITIDRSTKPSGYTPSSNHNIPNGVNSTLPTTNHTSEIFPNVEKTEVKSKEYCQALDAVIESARTTVRSEKEISELADKMNASHNQDLENQLKSKIAENDDLRKHLDKRTEDMNKLKAEYEAVLREQKSKQYLPKIRKTPEEQDIAAKEAEKQELKDMVEKMRIVRLQKEAQSREEMRANNETNQDNAAKLPPLTNTSAGQAVKVSSGAGVTQLPAISSATPPGSATSVKPSSNISTVSRPVSRDTTGITRQKLKDEGSEPPRSSSLKRSHSHPNIAQSHDEDLGDDLPASSQVPRINRGLKPSSHRTLEIATTPRRFVRNFEVVSSTEKSKTGLKNLGNTCYMNSIIQCLSHTLKLVNYLRNEEYLQEWHPSRSLTKGEATEELAAAVKQMHSGHRSISLLDLKSIVGKHHRSFRGYEQQDSHEFITILLDWLHEEMNRVPEKTPLKEQKNDGLTDEVAATRAWEDYKRSNDSKISELFCGQQKSSVTCGTCSRQSVTFEPFFILSVPIPISGRKCDIQQCIDFYTTEEELVGWNCVHCKKKVRATKKIDLWRLPPYLIIHLQRFYLDGYWKKRLTEIDFPVDNLQLNQKVLGKDCNITDKCPSYDYQLYGVSNHYGSMDGGHYTAYCRFSGPGYWWKFDDQEVCQINSRDVPTAAAYILFYQNRNC